MSESVSDMEFLTRDDKPIVPFNSMFLDCAYANFFWEFKEVLTHDSLGYDLLKIVGHGNFYLEVQKVSSTKFKVSLNRNLQEPNKVQDPGYYLEIIITILGHKECPQRKFIYCRRDHVYHIYEYNDMDVQRRKSNKWTIQCVVYMHEILPLSNEAAKIQNKLIKDLETEESCKRLADMAFLLNRESLDDIFSGRQDLEFARHKVCIIKRTLRFADQIADKVKAEGVEFQTRTPSEIYLCYILKEKLNPIKKHEVLDLYTLAHHFGLSYLAAECRNFMVCHLDPEFLVDVLGYSVTICDFKLISYAITEFIRNRDIVINTEAWKNLRLSKTHTARCILHIAERRIFSFLNRILAENEKMYKAQLLDIKKLDVQYHMEKNSQKITNKKESSLTELMLKLKNVRKEDHLNN